MQRLTGQVDQGGAAASAELACPIGGEAGHGVLMVPSSAALQEALDRSTTIEQLADFDRMMSVLDEAGKRFKLLVDEAIRVATFQLNGKRKLGLALMEHVGHGGYRARSQTANLLGEGALAGIDKDRRSRYKALARIPEDAFAAYLNAKVEKREIPKEAGVIRWVSLSRSAPKVRKGRIRSTAVTKGPTSLPTEIVEACLRCLGGVDVLIGKAKVKAPVRLDANENLSEKLRGKVLVLETAAPEVAIRSVATQRLAGAIQEAVVVLPRDIDHEWFAALGEGPWSCCVPREPGSPIVAHIGGRAHGFALVFAQFGVVLDVRNGVAGDRSA